MRRGKNSVKHCCENGGLNQKPLMFSLTGVKRNGYLIEKTQPGRWSGDIYEMLQEFPAEENGFLNPLD